VSFYTEEIERSHRFVLALRMGLPIFLLSVVSVFILFLQPLVTFTSIIFLIFMLLAIAVYFIFFLINQSAYEAITDSITHTFSVEYFTKLFYQRSSRNTVTLVMINVDNLTAINEKYGIKNGNAILIETVRQINEFFISKEIKKLPVCRYKGGNFIVLFMGEKEHIISLIELFLAKYQENNLNEIEIRLSAVLLDTTHVKQFNEILTRLFELEYASADKHTVTDDDDIIPAELEQSVLDALTYQRYSVATQTISCEKNTMYEVTFKLIDKEGGFIHQSRFIPLLNRLGKMREYESHLLEIVAKMAENSSVVYVVSISAVTLRNGLFFQHALGILQQYPKAKNKIILLFEEKEYSPQIKRFREQITQYRAVGYKIALDKYGGNHVTMMYLKEFDVDFLHFDILYTRHIMEEKYQNILQGLNITAHLCGAVTLMSMIEDAQSEDIAKRLKINCRQGNYHGKIVIMSTNVRELPSKGTD
jgi:EAL domain-containing protein (putative c-di-GMP-specific phosphodiesterase class I)/GGDEF domain-containing protein